jgi:drug/metabolite transporter (DMT)-like permease
LDGNIAPALCSRHPRQVSCSAAAYLLWNLALPALGVSVSNNLLDGVPLVSVVTGVLALGESSTGAMALGGTLILVGVVVVERTSGPG